MIQLISYCSYWPLFGSDWDCAEAVKRRHITLWIGEWYNCSSPLSIDAVHRLVKNIWRKKSDRILASSSYATHRRLITSIPTWLGKNEGHFTNILISFYWPIFLLGILRIFPLSSFIFLVQFLFLFCVLFYLFTLLFFFFFVILLLVDSLDPTIITFPLVPSLNPDGGVEFY